MYAYAKAVNKGYIDAQYRTIAEKAFNGLKQTLLLENPDGTLTLTRCCQVGGLGGTPYRDGSFEYYIGEKMRDNDAKATRSFHHGLPATWQIESYRINNRIIHLFKLAIYNETHHLCSDNVCIGRLHLSPRGSHRPPCTGNTQ